MLRRDREQEKDEKEKRERREFELCASCLYKSVKQNKKNHSLTHLLTHSQSKIEAKIHIGIFGKYHKNPSTRICCTSAKIDTHTLTYIYKTFKWIALFHTEIEAKTWENGITKRKGRSYTNKSTPFHTKSHTRKMNEHTNRRVITCAKRERERENFFIIQNQSNLTFLIIILERFFSLILLPSLPVDPVAQSCYYYCR